MSLGYFEIVSNSVLQNVITNDNNDFIEVWQDGEYEYMCVWLNHMESKVPSTIFKQLIE
jgi:hypothetical protein